MQLTTAAFFRTACGVVCVLTCPVVTHDVLGVGLILVAWRAFKDTARSLSITTSVQVMDGTLKTCTVSVRGCALKHVARRRYVCVAAGHNIAAYIPVNIGADPANTMNVR